MNEALNVLCLSADPAASRAVLGALACLPGFAVTAREVDPRAGLAELRDAAELHLAIVVLGAEPRPGLATIEEVHRVLPASQVLALAPDEHPDTIIRAMRAGADEFLPYPLDQAALLKVCIKVSALRGFSTGGSRGEVWVAHGATGGVGTTTLVANLGLALRAAERETALVDLDLHSGDLALFLNVTPGYSLRDVINDFKRLDSVFLQGAMIRHRSGLELLAAPSPEAGEGSPVVSSEQTLRVLELLDATHEITLVDTGSTPLDATRAAIGCADRILLVTELTLPALRACLRALDWFRQEGVDPGATVDLVVNKYANRSWEVAPGEASKTLGLPIRALVPRDDAAVCTAINSGLPLGEVRGGGAVQRAIAALASGGAAAGEASPFVKGFRRFFTGAERRA
jgi:pilus assembly protein CpaE